MDANINGAPVDGAIKSSRNGKLVNKQKRKGKKIVAGSASTASTQ